MTCHIHLRAMSGLFLCWKHTLVCNRGRQSRDLGAEATHQSVTMRCRVSLIIITADIGYTFALVFDMHGARPRF
jgi:hypothetical protein